VFNELVDYNTPLPSDFGEVTVKESEDDYSKSFGEHNAENELHGRGIERMSDGFIFVACYKASYKSIGSRIIIGDDGNFSVGECYLVGEDETKFRGT
jgi:hypothetical protein